MSLLCRSVPEWGKFAIHLGCFLLMLVALFQVSLAWIWLGVVGPSLAQSAPWLLKFLAFSNLTRTIAEGIICLYHGACALEHLSVLRRSRHEYDGLEHA